MRKLIALLLMLGILLSLSITPAFASDPAQDVMFIAPTMWLSEGLSGGPFTASGGAVDAGIICTSGSTEDILPTIPTGYQNKFGWVNLHLTKKFTCEDGSGIFYIQLNVRLDARGDHASWVIVGGTGDYKNLHGAGRLLGTAPEGPDEEGYIVVDIYNGMVN